MEVIGIENDGGERFTTEEIQNFSSSHPSSQLVDSITYDGADGTVNDAFKITNFWNIKTPFIFCFVSRPLFV